MHSSEVGGEEGHLGCFDGGRGFQVGWVFSCKGYEVGGDEGWTLSVPSLLPGIRPSVLVTDLARDTCPSGGR